MSSSQVPGGQRTLQKRKSAAEKKLLQLQQTPTSTRSAGAGGSSSTMLKLFTDEAQGLKVDPIVILVLAVGFVVSVVILHVFAKITGKLF